MDDDNFSEEELRKTVEDGEKNLRTATLVTNWCKNARVERSPGRGMLEQMTGVPIGHMGIACEHAPAGGMMCWRLEEAFLHHYIRNCKSCDKRLPGRGRDIQPVINDYLEKTARREADDERRKIENERRLEERRLRRLDIFDSTNPAAVQIRELLESVDADNKSADDAALALVKIARLAPDEFTSEIINYLESDVFSENTGLNKLAGDVLLNLPLSEQKKVKVALTNCQYGASDHVFQCIERNVSDIPASEISRILGPLVYLAVPARTISPESITPDPSPLTSLAKTHPNEMQEVVKQLLKCNDESDVNLAVRVIYTITPELISITDIFRRDIFAKLLRRKHLLPQFGRGSFDDRLQILRKVATQLYTANPEVSDELLTSLCQGGDSTSTKERAEIYAGALHVHWECKDIEATPARKLAFKRLIWIATENVTEYSHRSRQTFSHVDKKMANIASGEIDALFGAAVILSQTRKEVGKKGSIETAPSALEAIELSNKLSAIDSLQESFIQWAFMASVSTGLPGVKNILSLYENTPDEEIVFKSSIAKQLTELIVDTETLNFVLPHIYTALTHPEPLMRGNAATTIGEASTVDLRDFPDLIFDVYTLLLIDPNIFVHQSAVRSLNSFAFPDYLKPKIKKALYNLIFVYLDSQDSPEFLADCIICIVDSFMTESEIAGKPGCFVVSVINSLPDMNACNAIDRLTSSLRSTPGFSKTVARQLNSDWSHSVGKKNLYRALFEVPDSNLLDCVDEIYTDGERSATHNPYEASIPICLLARAGAYKKAVQLCSSILEEIPDTREKAGIRIFINTMLRVSTFESNHTHSLDELERELASWNSLLSLLESEKEEEDNESFPPFLLL